MTLDEVLCGITCTFDEAAACRGGEHNGKVNSLRPVASFTKEVNWRLPKRPLVSNGRLANRQLTSLVKEATGDNIWHNGSSVNFESNVDVFYSRILYS